MWDSFRAINVYQFIFDKYGPAGLQKCALDAISGFINGQMNFIGYCWSLVLDYSSIRHAYEKILSASPESITKWVE